MRIQIVRGATNHDTPNSFSLSLCGLFDFVKSRLLIKHLELGGSAIAKVKWNLIRGPTWKANPQFQTS
jgi:hypothetical protein